MDLKAFLAGERPSIPGRGFAGVVERPPEKPLIAAVEGYALAGGFEIALACDMVVAAENARFGLPEVKRGLVAAGGGLMRLLQKVPPGIAQEWALTGDLVDARRAYEVGLVNRLTPPGEALPAALELAATIAANGPLAVARDEADPPRGARVAGGADVRPPAPDQRTGPRLRGRPRGRDRLQGEARPAVARRLTGSCSGPHSIPAHDTTNHCRPGRCRYRNNSDMSE